MLVSSGLHFNSKEIKRILIEFIVRNGDFQAFTGDLKNEINVLNWLSDIETLEIPGVIEEVNSDMLLNIVTLEDDVLVFFYDTEDKDSEDILNELETIDEKEPPRQKHAADPLPGVGLTRPPTDGLVDRMSAAELQELQMGGPPHPVAQTNK